MPSPFSLSPMETTTTMSLPLTMLHHHRHPLPPSCRPTPSPLRVGTFWYFFLPKMPSPPFFPAQSPQQCKNQYLPQVQAGPRATQKNKMKYCCLLKLDPIRREVDRKLEQLGWDDEDGELGFAYHFYSLFITSM